MAAILCKTIGELLSACCECMKTPCDLLGQACSKSCQFAGEVMCTPFAPYLIVTLALNTPAVVFAIKAIEDYGCSPSLVRWLVINGAFGLVHMLAAFYITSIIRAPTPRSAPAIAATTGLNSAEEGTYQSNFRPLSEGTEIPGGANSFQRIKHVLCYDKGMAIYILVFLIWICWIGMGLVRRLSGADAGCDVMVSHMTTTIICGYVWMSLVGAAFCCSLLCLR